MKYPLAPATYSFNAAAGTITFSGTIPADISNILHVTNITRGVLYFQPQAGSSYAGTYASPTLTLAASTVGHSNTDKLLIVYDDGGVGATAAKQDTGNTSLASLDSKSPALVSGRVPVDGSAVTQPVSAASLPLPTGAATSAKQPALGTAGTPSTDVITVQGNASGTAIPISASSLPLPTGAATDATLSNINSKTPALGQTTMSGSQPVAIATDQPAITITDSGILSLAKESLDIAQSGLAGLVLQEDTVPDPTLPAGPALQVTLRDAIQVDQGSTVVTGGIDVTGAVQKTRLGQDGGTQLTDCKQFVGTTQIVNGTPTGWIDTTGYQSIVVSFFGSMVATVQYQTSNDQQTFSPIVAYSLSGAQSASTSSVSPGNGGMFVLPTTGKYFRIVVTSYTSGIVGTSVVLRSTPYALGTTSIPSVNVSQVAGSAVQISQGTAALGVGGITRSGSQANALSQIYGTYTQLLSTQGSNNTINSYYSPLTIGGVDSTYASRPLLTDTIGAPAVTSAPSNQSQQSIQELLYQILATLRASAYYQYELAYENSSRCAADEPDNLIGDFLYQANQFNNFTN